MFQVGDFEISRVETFSTH